MSDSGYTPTTADVENGYVHDPEAEYRDPVNYPHGVEANRRAFRRWLAAHDAVIREDERKLQIERDAQLVIEQGETLSNTGLNVRNALWGVARVIRGQSFTGTESETNV